MATRAPSSDATAVLGAEVGSLKQAIRDATGTRTGTFVVPLPRVPSRNASVSVHDWLMITGCTDVRWTLRRDDACVSFQRNA